MTTATRQDDPFRARTREELEKLRQPPTPALSECTVLTLRSTVVPSGSLGTNKM
jgi:hypothetical protein